VSPVSSAAMDESSPPEDDAVDFAIQRTDVVEKMVNALVRAGYYPPDPSDGIVMEFLPHVVETAREAMIHMLEMVRGESDGSITVYCAVGEALHVARVASEVEWSRVENGAQTRQTLLGCTL